MKRTIMRRSSAVIMTVVLLFTTVFSISIFASAATTFTPRLSAPASNNKYYYSDNNLFYKYGYGMPNCTAYAYGRAYEILDTVPNLCPYNAEEWYDYNIDNDYYGYGDSPKLGAIACWSYDGGGGHVAVVEKIENGEITFSNSAWNGTNFYLSYADTTDSNAGGPSWWNFQGYIYIGDFKTPTTPTTPTTPSYEPGVYKSNVSDSLNMRSGAGTSYSWVASIPNGQTLTVTEVKVADGYNWGKTTYSGKTGWVALEYCTVVNTYKPGIYKVNVNDSLNMRSGAGTSYSWVTYVPNGQSLTVTSVKAADGYNWGKTTYNGKSGWVALEYCKYVSALTASSAPTTEAPTTEAPTTVAPTTVAPTTEAPTTVAPTTVAPTTEPQTTVAPTTVAATTLPTTTQPGITKPQGLGVGDVNMDGTIDVQDATLIQKYLAGFASLTDEQVNYCDFNFDNNVTVMDSTDIQKYLTYTNK